MMAGYNQNMTLSWEPLTLLYIRPYPTPNCNEGDADKKNKAVFSEKTDVPHLPSQSMVAISVMKL